MTKLVLGENINLLLEKPCSLHCGPVLSDKTANWPNRSSAASRSWGWGWQQVGQWQLLWLLFSCALVYKALISADLAFK